MKLSSEILQSILHSSHKSEMTVRRFTYLFGTKSLALVIFIFSLPHFILIIEPPGVSTITGIPILILSLQIMFGGDKISIPKKIAQKKIPRKVLKRCIKIILPVIKFIEKLFKPRLKFMFSKNGQRIIGFFIFVMALILATPIPGGNFLPALSIALLSLALLQRNGILAIIAMLFSIASVYFMYSIIVLAIKGIAGWIKKII